jgi:pantoate--beta-alanine ligase
MTQWSNLHRQKAQTIAFVPTMGYLHKGHLSLMKEGRRLADKVVISIFINPTQFGPGEDFATYPRNLDRDCALAKDAGVDIIFTPDAQDLYPHGFETFICQENLPKHLCGLSRKGHFNSVMTIVAKLFNIVAPHLAVFGEKDFQQLTVIRQMAKDLNFNIKIIGHPTVREPDGLAMSSRNTKLDPSQRKTALSLIASLQNAKQRVKDNVSDPNQLIREATDLIKSYPDTKIDYIKICDPETLDDVSTIDRPVLMALAVKVGETRLIDNMILTPDSHT